MKRDFSHEAAFIFAKAHTWKDEPETVTAWIQAQLALAYQEGICDGLRQSEVAIKAAFDKFQGRVEP